MSENRKKKPRKAPPRRRNSASKNANARTKKQVPISAAGSRRLRVATKIIEFIDRQPGKGTGIVLPDGCISLAGPDGRPATVEPREIEACLKGLLSVGRLSSVSRCPEGFAMTVARPKAAPRAAVARTDLRPTPSSRLPPVGDVMREVLAAACAGASRHADIRTAATKALGVDPAVATTRWFRMSFSGQVSQCIQVLRNLGHLDVDGKSIAIRPEGRKRLASGTPFDGKELPGKRRFAGASAPALQRLTRRLDEASVEKMLNAIPTMRPDKLVSSWTNANRTLSDPKKAELHEKARQIILAVEKAWDALVLEEGELFLWPSTEVGPASGASSPSGFRSEGMLSYLEYRVGKNADCPAPVRQLILSRVFEGKLPKVYEPAYMAEWGDPMSARRLKKMAESLAAFARNAKRKDEDRYDEAIRQWEQDLDFLYHRYYVGRFGFGWPTTGVGPRFQS